MNSVIQVFWGAGLAETLTDLPGGLISFVDCCTLFLDINLRENLSMCNVSCVTYYHCIQISKRYVFFPDTVKQ